MADHLPLVLLHGWGFDHRIWDGLLPLLDPSRQVITLDLPGFGAIATEQDLLQSLPPRAILMGWSLGGMVATDIAIRYPRRVAGLITVGSNLKWVGTDTWPGASAENFAAFFENLAQNFEGTKQHFCGVIGRGDNREKEIIKQLRSKLSPAAQENFIEGLRWLDRIDNRAGYTSLAMPGLHFFGERDAMVPLAVERGMRSLNKTQQTCLLPGVSHAPFLSLPEMFAEAVNAFTGSLPYRRDKKQVATSFSRAATTYDTAAGMQREMGDRLLQQMPFLPCAVILDAGCGTGYCSRILQERYPAAQIISLDLAHGMLLQARNQHRINAPLCADAESLPLADQSVDMIFSNLAIQWCDNYPQLFGEWRRVLAPGGHILLSTFIDGTLQELEQAWRAVDSAVHVNRFVTATELAGAAQNAGLQLQDSIDLTQQRNYDSVLTLARELKALGAHNINSGRKEGLTGKRQLQQLAQAYEKFRQGPTLGATYRLFCLHLTR